MTDNFKYQSQFVDDDNITQRDQMENLKITNNSKYFLFLGPTIHK